MKLYEAFSPAKGATIDITVGSETKTLTLGRFTLELMVQYESEGTPIDSIIQLMGTKPATYATKLGWDLLHDKDEFDNDINVFRKILSLEDIAKLGDAIMRTVENSKPKNVEGEELK